jgi:aminoglycoside phosphotransferase (APT) family kinase protein
MTDEPSSPPTGDVTDAAVRRMVGTLKQRWRVESIERNPHGTDFVATLDVQTPQGKRTIVLKATTADLVAPVIARSEPRLLELVGRETSIPVPTVFGYCDEHDMYPAPFYLIDHVVGENYEGQPERLSLQARKRILQQAGQNLAELHMLGPLPAVGNIGVHNGHLMVLDTDENPRYNDFRDWLLLNSDKTLNRLTTGGYFPELADDPTRFADLVPNIRQYLQATIPNLSEPDPPTYCHRDYRYGNLLVDSETGTTQAVLDWANLLSADPAYNLANAESLLLDTENEDERTNSLRHVFRTAYADVREDWTFDEATRERMDVYHLTCRLDAMACLPLWHQDATPEERDERAMEHREFVARYDI